MKFTHFVAGACVFLVILGVVSAATTNSTSPDPSKGSTPMAANSSKMNSTVVDKKNGTMTESEECEDDDAPISGGAKGTREGKSLNMDKRNETSSAGGSEKLHGNSTKASVGVPILSTTLLVACALALKA